MVYLHKSVFQSHGYLSSANCHVDNKWALKVSGFALHAFGKSDDEGQVSVYILLPFLSYYFLIFIINLCHYWKLFWCWLLSYLMLFSNLGLCKCIFNIRTKNLFKIAFGPIQYPLPFNILTGKGLWTRENWSDIKVEMKLRIVVNTSLRLQYWLQSCDFI